MLSEGLLDGHDSLVIIIISDVVGIYGRAQTVLLLQNIIFLSQEKLVNRFDDCSLGALGASLIVSDVMLREVRLEMLYDLLKLQF